MNIWDDMPDLPKCPHCGHDGEGLQWAFPDHSLNSGGGASVVQCACLACGAHGPERGSYADAISAFASGEIEGQNDPLGARMETTYTKVRSP